MSLRILLAIAASADMEIHQADVKETYLNGKLAEVIYMEYPEGITPKGSCDVLRLKGSLYGLRQSGRTWWIELGNGLTELWFKKLESDWGLYHRPSEGTRGAMMVLAYVDDIVVAAKTTLEIQTVLDGLQKRWKMTELGEISHILGLKVTRNRKAKKIWLTQPAYIERLIERFPGHPTRKRTTPLGSKGNADNAGDLVPLSRFQEIVGCLQWIATCTRPDISFAASYLARYTAEPRETHWEFALGVTSYLRHTQDEGLTLGGPEAPLEGWVDANWAGYRDSRRSTTDYVFKINGSLIVWSSRRQATVASSTVEAEYVAAAEAAREAVWLRGLLEEIDCKITSATVLHCNNQGSIRLSFNPAMHQRMKHINIKHHMIRELIEKSVVSLVYIPTASQQADILTKGLRGPRHSENSVDLGLSPPRKTTGTIGSAMISEAALTGKKEGCTNHRRRPHHPNRSNEVSIERGRRGEHDSTAGSIGFEETAWMGKDDGRKTKREMRMRGGEKRADPVGVIGGVSTVVIGITSLTTGILTAVDVAMPTTSNITIDLNTLTLRMSTTGDPITTKLRTAHQKDGPHHHTKSQGEGLPQSRRGVLRVGGKPSSSSPRVHGTAVNLGLPATPVPRRNSTRPRHRGIGDL